MKIAGPIFALVVLTCLAYTCVGQIVPQKEQHPPKSAGAGASPSELAKVGKDIYDGSCKQCHGDPGGGGGRGPDLDGIAARAVTLAAARSEETGTAYTPEDYLAESLVDPGATLALDPNGAPYGNIMSFKLSPIQTLSVLNFLMSLGGTPKVTAEGEVWKKWGQPIGEEDEGGAAGPPPGPMAQGSPEEMITKYGCDKCHDFEGKTILPSGGPWLSDIGGRMSPGDILTQIVIPDSEIAAPVDGTTFSKGLMRATLDGNGFYFEVGPDDLHRLVLWLAAKKGGAAAPAGGGAN